MCIQVVGPLHSLCGTQLPGCLKERPLFVEAEDEGVLFGADVGTIAKVAVGAAAVAAGVHLKENERRVSEKW